MLLSKVTRGMTTMLPLVLIIVFTALAQTVNICTSLKLLSEALGSGLTLPILVLGLEVSRGVDC